MARDTDFFVRFWGTRGSIACSAPNTARYGGNTSCLEMRCGGRLLIFDAGTGIRYLGNELIQDQGPLDIDVFLTHTHLDHIFGFPFFRPMFVPGNKVRIWAGHLLPKHTIRGVLQDLMTAPLFPVPLEIFQADLDFRDFRAGETHDMDGGISIRTAPLNHPNNATGYRVEFEGRSICYITDTEHVDGAFDQNVVELIRGADIFVYDSMFSATEFTARSGWGHSTWAEGLRLSDEAGVKTFVAFHHDPDHDDDFLDGVARELEATRQGSIVAHDGMVLRP